MEIRQILLKYWGFPSFRPLQEEIIQSVLNGSDTLALLPTGGGKSICYQVPALAREGLCLVISPLIALMKDQVDNLKKRGIKAAAIYSGMHRDEIDLVLSNAKFGDTKLLYISPERLESTQMRDAIMRMKINLLAVDEAHCISQWGYDFRPPYLKIAEIRPMITGVPIMALTATATPKVVKDIQQKLLFPKENLFQQSFERKNLTYVVIREEDKRNRLLKIIRKVSGPGIVYVRNRRETKEIAGFLTKHGVPADCYHAGLDGKTRDRRQQAWMKEEPRVMVATNAFGMGIDKPNVRFVVHLDLPDCIESYFQEAGRAGRDLKRSWAILLYEEADIVDARQNLRTTYPELNAIRNTYQALGNYFQIPVGGGDEQAFEFDINRFCDQFNLPPVIAYNSLKILEKEGYVMLNEGIRNPSRIFIKADKEQLYRFQVSHKKLDQFLKTLLRSYPGLFTGFVIIRETDLAKRLNLEPNEVSSGLKFMQTQGILDYIPQIAKPTVVYLQERVDTRNLYISPEHHKTRLTEATLRLDAMIGYANSTNRCRSQALLAYFGETTTKRCGRCDVCLERNKLALNEQEFNEIISRIKPLLIKSPVTLEEIVRAASPVQEEKVLLAIRWLLDNKKITKSKDNIFAWKHPKLFDP
ncbi:MAG: RecQ family ATP-dependent DNA helicase [Bacteroidetes bacterium]|nr:MAG: RecQ family ATP-dependent DNA helicase [Bacteroidota bacterium]